MIKIVSHPLLGEVTLSRTRRARRISIGVRGSGAVRLSFPYGVSQACALEFLERKMDWILRTRERLRTRQAALPRHEPLPPAARRSRIEELRRMARVDLPARVERISGELGLRHNGLTIRASRTRWGSCTSRNTLSLSLFLMLLPEHLRDYVIVHELCHTVHHNHSPQFHALVDRFLGGREKALAGELKRYSIDL